MKTYYFRYMVLALAMVLIVLGSTRALAAADRAGGFVNFLRSGSPALSSDAATETVQPSETAQPSETTEPSETPEAGEDGEFSGTVEQISDSAWIISGQTFMVTADTEIDSGIAVGDTVRVEFFTNADGSLTATQIEIDSHDDVNDNDDDQGEDENEDGEFFGTVEQMTATAWIISGRTFLVTAGTEIDGGIAAGDTVKVEFFTNADGSLTATEIEADHEDDHEGDSDEDGYSGHGGDDDSGGDDHSGSGGDDDSGHGGDD